MLRGRAALYTISPIMKSILTLTPLLLLATFCSAQPQFNPVFSTSDSTVATSTEVNAGVDATKTVTPSTLAGWSALLSPGIIYVDAISGSDTNTGTIARPYATLTNAQSVATNGQTIVGLRGTFAEQYLGKAGVSWYFNEGCVLSADGAFLVTSTNANLMVRGRGAFTNQVVIFSNVTNGSVYVEGKSAWGSQSSSALIYDLNHGFSVSNSVYFKFDWARGLNVYGPSTVSNIFLSATVEGGQFLRMNSTAGSNSGQSNNLITIRAPRVYPSAGNFANTLNTVYIEADFFSRTFTDGTSYGISALNSNYVWNVSVLTTNDLNTNLPGIWRGSVVVIRP